MGLIDIIGVSPSSFFLVVILIVTPSVLLIYPWLNGVARGRF